MFWICGSGKLVGPRDSAPGPRPALQPYKMRPQGPERKWEVMAPWGITPVSLLFQNSWKAYKEGIPKETLETRG